MLYLINCINIDTDFVYVNIRGGRGSEEENKNYIVKIKLLQLVAFMV